MEFNEKQLQIMDVAERLFSKNGFAGTSVRDIAQEAGINVAMISYYFGSKEKLLESVFLHRISSSRPALENLAQNKELSPFEKVETLIDDYVNKMITNADFYRLIFREQLAGQLNNISDLINEGKVQNMELVGKIIQEGQRKKDFVKNLNVPMLITTIIGTCLQMMGTQSYQRKINKMEGLSNEEFETFMVKKLKAHLKNLFKAVLTYESK